MDNRKGQRLLSYVRSVFSCSRFISRNLTALSSRHYESYRRELQANLRCTGRAGIARIRKVHISGAICGVIAAGANGPEDSPIIRNCCLLSRARDRTRPRRRQFVSQDALMRLLPRICKYDSM